MFVRANVSGLPMTSSGTQPEPLTNREVQVLALIASGRLTKEIASDLGIGFKTVACYRYRLLQKLKARNAADLTRAAIRMKLVEP